MLTEPEPYRYRPAALLIVTLLQLVYNIGLSLVATTLRSYAICLAVWGGFDFLIHVVGSLICSMTECYPEYGGPKHIRRELWINYKLFWLLVILNFAGQIVCWDNGLPDTVSIKAVWIGTWAYVARLIELGLYISNTDRYYRVGFFE